jgi:hypothetical protein
VRDHVLHTVGAKRGVIPGHGLAFLPGRAAYDADVRAVNFFARAILSSASGEGIRCQIEHDALKALSESKLEGRADCLAEFQRNRPKIARIAQAKYLGAPVSPSDDLVPTRSDFQNASHESA